VKRELKIAFNVLVVFRLLIDALFVFSSCCGFLSSWQEIHENEKFGKNEEEKVNLIELKSFFKSQLE
jgi:hypothetical protein